MPRVELTTKLLESLTAPKAGRLELADAKCTGLEYRITAAGVRSWCLRYRMTGSRTMQRYTLKPDDKGELLPLAAARVRGEALRALIRDGRDPALAVQQEKADVALKLAATRAETARLTAADDALPTLDALTKRWLRHVEATRAPSTADGYRRSMALHVLPTLGATKVCDLERKHVAALHEAMTAKPIGANKMLAALSVLMSWAEQDGARPTNTNPCFGVHRFAEVKRQRFLTHEELQRVGAALVTAETIGLPVSDVMAKKPRGMSKKRRAALTGRTRGADKKPPQPKQRLVKADTFAVAAIRLMLFSGWRLHEVVTTRWSDVNLTLRVVHHRTTKTGATSRPVSLPAVELLKALPRIDGSPWVFPASRDPKQHIGKPRRLWDAVRQAAGLMSADKADRVVPHDLRHTVGAMGATAGLSLPVIASMLGHKQVSTTERYSHLHRDARHDAADLVAEEIAAAMRGTKTAVTPIDRKKKA